MQTATNPRTAVQLVHIRTGSAADAYARELLGKNGLHPFASRERALAFLRARWLYIARKHRLKCASPRIDLVPVDLERSEN
jgi:hypothetical protein